MFNNIVKDIIVIDNTTEKHIIDTAMTVFFKEGRINATTQEIADAAGINRTLIHYYFRSRDKLFAAVNREASYEYVKGLNAIYTLDRPFKEKIVLLLNNIIKKHTEYPFLEMYMSTGVIQMGLKKDPLTPISEDVARPFKTFLNEVQQELDKGNIEATNAIHFMTNILSLTIYPFLMRPIQLRLYNMNDDDYQKILDERVEEIMRILFARSK